MSQCIFCFSITCQERSPEFSGLPPKGGGQALFLKIDNSPTLKCHNFFVFGPIYNSLKVGIKHGRNYSSADFWDLRPFYRPEISVGRNFCVFSWMTCLPPPLFFRKMKIFKKKFLFCLMSVHMSSGWQLIFWTMWYFSCFWGKKSTRCCKKQGFLNKTVHFPLEMVQKIFFEELTINMNRNSFLVLLC